MYLKNIHLKQFRNYQDQKVEFTAAKTILLGNNAQGKSNLLEAVELLATLRSHRLGRDRDFIQSGKDVAQIHALLEGQNGISEAALTLRRNHRRSVAINGASVRRQMDFLGLLNAVQFSSLDLDLVRGSPEHRRHWLDTLLIQLEPIYAHILQQYNQVLRQRNADFKKTANSAVSTVQAKNRLRPNSTLAIWDAQLVTTGTKVMRRRARALQRLAPLATAWHSSISGSKEILQINYLPNVSWADNDPEQIHAAFFTQIHQRAAAELYRGTTLVGPHRDEIELMINQTPVRQYGSQGQQRTLVLALKLAELQLIEQVVQEPPLLLLDDVLAELDPFRQNQLLDAIQDRFQTLITTTHLSSFDAQWLNSSQILYVKSGQITPTVNKDL
ncbi:DNA replication/repair protein RecF [Umezakia ovalisporum]|jgi:DNA replication and repair protein RecF|uniref:DNA replication and repair protein RecF n=2 Tax=Umezakia ovalisporum TaxID=75695 RepID=A0AA43GWB1_9CYAN|nr:DNA replication/repair protein RecF [Umezakia ovalisporum]MDH6057329.1 DNA replication/repair protein RecF [Umezakia ovalisporum FSS-43]MDH6062405.1 DNA replication/repair protein RecF [Umezakia ovalisporum FSS-62]MDH6069153.1 DNA replication/repair protein RecF [Umezakia ovalisporum APH033B]MDH6072751.1 DNA replication/repair protein RecF [Umezakia ovalisporum CobakiLakeA]MDH6075596.1 DNA replication/repair protein RecF [Umezakia ovalisporum CS-1034]